MIELLHDIKLYIEPRKTALHTIERFQPDVVFLKNVFYLTNQQIFICHIRTTIMGDSSNSIGQCNQQTCRFTCKQHC